MKGYAKNQIQKAFKNPSFMQMSNLFTPIFSGIGSIVMLHRVVANEKDFVCEELEITTEHLEEIIQYFIEKDYKIVSLDEAYEIITGKVKTNKKFAAITFDDGYKDNYTLAYPIFKKYNVPFAIYITTSFPDKTALLWWYALKELINKSQVIRFVFDNETYEYDVRNQHKKNSVYIEIRNLILSLSTDQQKKIYKHLFNENAIDIQRYSNELTMDWKQIKELSHDELVTIGAHTTNHYNLRMLKAELVKKEIYDSKERIESFTQIKVEHFAFPFGSQNEAGKREIEIAGMLGFKTCTTTRCGNIFSKHSQYMNCLPRITPSPYLLASFPYCYANGFVPAVKQKFKRVVTE